jgi:hypothetical protein
MSVPPTATSVLTQRVGKLTCFLILLGLLISFQALSLPRNLDYSAFAFGEPGANLNTAYLVQHGLRPAIDFGHSYGLLGILLLDVWTRLTGLTPQAYFALIFLLEVIMVAVLAEFVMAAKLSPLSIVFVAAALPLIIWMNYFNVAHAVETLCLLVAITAHLKGRYDMAVAAAAAAVLARPALGYVYGAFVVSVVFLKIVRGSLRASSLLLASLSAICLILLLAQRFGTASVVRTIYPSAGMANYRILDYGFFRRGMAFWWPSPFTIHHYFGVPGFWLLAAICAMLLGPVAPFRAAHGDGLRQRKAEFVLAAGIVVFVWIFFAFSHQYIGSWILYLFFPVLGIAVLGDLFPGFGIVLVVMILVALNADRHEVESRLIEWRTAHRSTLLPDLFSHGDEDQSVRQLFDVVRKHRTVVLQYSGAVSLLHAGLGEPVNEWFSPGISVPAEIDRERSQVAAAEFVLIPTPRWFQADTVVFYWPEYLDVRRGYRMVFQDSMGMVLAARPSTAQALPGPG